jgi:acetyltransferase-like isoleucine patch superfamily enzyme
MRKTPLFPATAAKWLLDWGALAIAAPFAVTSVVDRLMGPTAEAMFLMWAQAFALVPGPPGVFLRRAYYRLTLEHCARSFFVGFGAFFSHRHARIEHGVYIGPYAVVGCATLRRGASIGTRAAVLSGTALHDLDGAGRWGPSDLTRLRRVEVGEYALIGEAALVMADVGASAMVAAGGVVSARVAAGIVVAGNPARFVRRLTAERAEAEEANAV